MIFASFANVTMMNQLPYARSLHCMDTSLKSVPLELVIGQNVYRSD